MTADHAHDDACVRLDVWRLPHALRAVDAVVIHALCLHDSPKVIQQYPVYSYGYAEGKSPVTTAGAGHSNTRTTEVVYRRELRPVLTTGAEAMDRLFQRSSVPADSGRRPSSRRVTAPGRDAGRARRSSIPAFGSYRVIGEMSPVAYRATPRAFRRRPVATPHGEPVRRLRRHRRVPTRRWSCAPAGTTAARPRILTLCEYS